MRPNSLSAPRRRPSTPKDNRIISLGALNRSFSVTRSLYVRQSWSIFCRMSIPADATVDSNRKSTKVRGEKAEARPKGPAACARVGARRLCGDEETIGCSRLMGSRLIGELTDQGLIEQPEQGSSLESASYLQLGCEDGNSFRRNHDDAHQISKTTAAPNGARDPGGARLQSSGLQERGERERERERAERSGREKGGRVRCSRSGSQIGSVARFRNSGKWERAL